MINNSFPLLSRAVSAFISGALFPYSLSPYDFWIAAIVSPLWLYILTRYGKIRNSVSYFYLYSLGMFSVGVHWIFFSVHDYGNASDLLAGTLVFLFVVFYSLVSIPGGYVYARFFRDSDICSLLAFVSIWVLQEWIRSWLFTGFPWLYLGYGVMGTWLEKFSPFLGIFGVSFVVVYVSISFWLGFYKKNINWIVFPALLVFISPFLDRWEFSESIGKASVSLVQGNVDQHSKWSPENRQAIFRLYLDASQEELGRDIIIWPEASVTYLKQTIESQIKQLDKEAKDKQSALIFGVPSRTEDGYFQNSLMAIGQSEGHYIKRRLVPFGEYVPMEKYLRGLIAFFDLPMSRNSSGPVEQLALTFRGKSISSSICYEIAYPDLVRKAARNPVFLLTVSNDTWFGDSIGPWQHLQLARMRALENDRALIRATNNGITAVIDNRGKIVSSLPQFSEGILRDTIELRQGETPFHRFGSYPILILSILLLIIASARLEE
ncbi:MAG: apolipoprotein N-acyltransferase [Gammaproteobacteria bacterium]|nr:apolipoprotein N-acyltransferase [Gammaproteobacteria bacterium]